MARYPNDQNDDRPARQRDERGNERAPRRQDEDERYDRRNLDRIPYDITMPPHFPPLYGRRGDPEEIAQLALFLASDASRHITGAVIPVDAAFSLAR